MPLSLIHIFAKMIVDVLYPCDDHYAGKELRLKQQYFFISASLQALLVRYKKKHDDVRKLHEKVTIQMNDTHPTLAVAELMHLLLDQEGLEWDEAWDVTTKTVAYTNHTIMAEALEKWPIDLFSKLLPRIYQIIQEIDRKMCIRDRYLSRPAWKDHHFDQPVYRPRMFPCQRTPDPASLRSRRSLAIPRAPRLSDHL